MRCLPMTALAVLLLAACGGDDVEKPDGGTLAAPGADASSEVPTGATEDLPGILALAEADGRFATLLAALDQADLAADLGGGDYTLFAPTDAAFAALGDGMQAALMDPANRGQLRTLLRYHLVSGERLAGSLSDGGSLRTLTGRPLMVQDSGGLLVVGDGGAVVTDADLRGANGVVHVIDAVLLPPEDLL